MVTLTFDLDYNKMERDGITEADMLNPMREHSKKYGIEEISKGVFAMDGEHAMCVIGMFVINITRENYRYISYFKNWIFDVNGEKEDCIKETIKWYNKKGIQIPVTIGG